MLGFLPRALLWVQVNGGQGCDLPQGCARSALSAPSGSAMSPSRLQLSRGYWAQLSRNVTPRAPEKAEIELFSPPKLAQ